ncbi:MAG: patatin-like phospholipase family protein [Bacillaceae bacterium]|nr:patatin-like phospholipase family protein [Bacillaceae bacterium]
MYEAGVSLGGGSLRGAAHIGALQEMIQQNYFITHIAGTSAGALIGGLFACGIQPNQMGEILESLSIRKHMDFSLNRKGFLKGERIYQTLLKLTDGRHFSDLEIPFSVVCVDLNSRKAEIINEGEVARALRASIAIPGIFSPVEMGDKLLADGYIINNNPADVVKKMGADRVIAIRVLSSKSQSRTPGNAITCVSRYMDIASHINTDQLLENYADTIIDIDLVNVGRFKPKLIPDIIERGRMAARKALSDEVFRAKKPVERVI